jgi:hypothetical protein
MKRAAFSSDLYFKTDRYYPASEIFTLAKEKLGEKFVPIDMRKELGLEKVFFQGADKYNIYIFSSKNKQIYITQRKPIKQALKDGIVLSIICFLTLGIGFIIWRIIDKIRFLFGIQGTKASRALMRELGTELEKLIGKK